LQGDMKDALPRRPNLNGPLIFAIFPRLDAMPLWELAGDLERRRRSLDSLYESLFRIVSPTVSVLFLSNP
jgi:hypothetical protein